VRQRLTAAGPTSRSKAPSAPARRRWRACSASRLGAELLLEKTRGEPFLDASTPRRRLRLPGPAVLLSSSRIEQPGDCAEPGMFSSQRVVSDFHVRQGCAVRPADALTTRIRSLQKIQAQRRADWSAARPGDLAACGRRPGSSASPAAALRSSATSSRLPQRLCDAYAAYFAQSPSHRRARRSTPSASTRRVGRGDIDRLSGRCRRCEGPRETLDPPPTIRRVTSGEGSMTVR
jgi:hypothetical protein